MIYVDIRSLRAHLPVWIRNDGAIASKLLIKVERNKGFQIKSASDRSYLYKISKQYDLPIQIYKANIGWMVVKRFGNSAKGVDVFDLTLHCLHHANVRNSLITLNTTAIANAHEQLSKQYGYAHESNRWFREQEGGLLKMYMLIYCLIAADPLKAMANIIDIIPFKCIGFETYLATEMNRVLKNRRLQSATNYITNCNMLYCPIMGRNAAVARAPSRLSALQRFVVRKGTLDLYYNVPISHDKYLLPVNIDMNNLPVVHIIDGKRTVLVQEMAFHKTAQSAQPLVELLQLDQIFERYTFDGPRLPTIEQIVDGNVGEIRLQDEPYQSAFVSKAL